MSLPTQREMILNAIASLDEARARVDAAITSRGHEASGHFWEDVARYLIP
jgi:hypothetical protein